MSEPLILVDFSEIREGKLADLKEAVTELAGFVARNEPRVIAYNVYLDHEGTRLTVVQVHPDPASAEFHMHVAGSAFPGFREYIRMSRIDVYGKPGDDLLELLQRKARMLGTGRVVVHERQAGFIRSAGLDPNVARELE